jgi:SAM-dependent methyltransferase
MLPNHACWFRRDAVLGFDLLGARKLQPEIMDEPDMSGERHAQALRGLERINALSGSARMLWPAVAGLARENSGKPVRILDVATGAGDVPIRLWRRAKRAGVWLELSGCDRSASAIAYAQRRAEGRASVRFFEWDVQRSDLPAGYDAIMTSLFLHHLCDKEAVHLLKRMARAAQRLVLVNDLARSLKGLVLAYFGTRVLSRSPIVHLDGVRSVRAAFTIKEVCSLACRAGLADALVARRWPCRYLLTWRKA